MLKTLGSTESTIRFGKSGVEIDHNGGDDGIITSVLRMSLSSNSSTRITQIVAEYDRVDNSGICRGDCDKKFAS